MKNSFRRNNRGILMSCMLFSFVSINYQMRLHTKDEKKKGCRQNGGPATIECLILIIIIILYPFRWAEPIHFKEVDLWALEAAYANRQHPSHKWVCFCRSMASRCHMPLGMNVFTWQSNLKELRTGGRETEVATWNMWLKDRQIDARKCTPF